MTDAQRQSAPAKLRLLKAERVLEIAWSTEGPPARLAARTLRCDCRCASCVDEITGRRILDIGKVPSDIGIDGVELVGNYALKIRFADGHDTGLFTWEHLRSLGG